MPNTYSQLYVQVVFAVKGKLNLISKHFRDELEKYICGVITNKNAKTLAIYANPDHIHIFISFNPETKISDLVRDIKANSSRFINEKKFVVGKFQWQIGYGAFTYSISQIDRVVKYINNQEAHHKKGTFREEYISFLKNFKIDYDEKYLFEFLE